MSRYEMWKTMKERPEARKQIEEMIRQGKTLNDVFFESNEERHLPTSLRKYTVDVKKQSFLMVMQRLDAHKQSLIKQGWIEVSDGSVVHPDDKRTLRIYGYKKPVKESR